MHFAFVHLTGRTVDRDIVALFQLHAVNFDCAILVVYVQCACARYAAFTHATSHHSSVRGHTTASRQNTFGYSHTCQILRRRLEANHHHEMSLGVPFGGIVGKKDDLARRSAR